MSEDFIRGLDRYLLVVRDRSEITASHGKNGELEAVTPKSHDQLPVSFLFFFPREPVYAPRNPRHPVIRGPMTAWIND